MSEFKFPKVLIHVGRPDLSKPHEDFSVLNHFFKDNQDVALVLIVDTEEERVLMEERCAKELKLPKGHPGGLVVTWNTDGEMVDFLCAKMFGTVSWRVVGNGWYECEEGHQTGPTMKVPLETCPTCQKKMEFIRHNEDRVEKFRALLEKACALMKFDTRSGTLLKTLVSPDGNVLKNMQYIGGCEHHKAPDLEDFAGKGKGKAAICVSAGPSLDFEIDNLRRLQDSCLILCVGRVYKRLKAAEIRVDYTFSCEMFDWDASIFDGLTKESVGDTVMCYPNVCAPATVKIWPGKKVCMMDAQMADFLGKSKFMMGGNSVSHHQLNFAAEVLDCDEIVLVGQDLSYTRPDVTHATGSSSDKWPDDVKAQDNASHSEIEWGPCYGKGGRFHPTQHRAPAVMGPGKVLPMGPMEVMTSKPYKNFATLFEILIARHKKKVLNACGEGLVIDGAPYVDLSEYKK